MNKYSIIVFTIILAIFGGILYATQGNSFLKTANQVPSLPPEADILRPITSALQQSQTGEQQPQQAGQQTQQAVKGDEMGPPKASMSATLKTTKGTIIISLTLKDAPSAINNFVAKAKSGFYNNLTFHRVEDWVIQGGDPSGTGNGGNPFQTELNRKPFTTGSVGWAASNKMQVGQGARISNDSQFFITTQDADWLDGQYTNFGTVTSGMDVANRIAIGDKILGITIK